MHESGYQSKLINGIIGLGGSAITGVLKTGEADIQAGYPVEVGKHNQAMKGRPEGYITFTTILAKLAVEVKTPEDYDRVMSGLVEVDGLYKIVNKARLKKHEPLQVYKLNDLRKRGGLALFAHSLDQVKAYVEEQF